MALDVTKLSNVETPEIDGHPMILWSVESAEHGCGIGQCVVAYNITTPYLWKTSLYIKDGESESHNIAANHPKSYSRFIFRQSGTQDFPADEFYRAIILQDPSVFRHASYCSRVWCSATRIDAGSRLWMGILAYRFAIGHLVL